MILSGLEIAERMGKDIGIEPYDPAQLNPNSYNLRLHNELLVYDDAVLDMKLENKASKLTIPENRFAIGPREVVSGPNCGTHSI